MPSRRATHLCCACLCVGPLMRSACVASARFQKRSAEVQEFRQSLRLKTSPLLFLLSLYAVATSYVFTDTSN